MAPLEDAEKKIDPLTRRVSVLEGIARGERAIKEGSNSFARHREEAYGAMAELIWTEPALSDLDGLWMNRSKK